MNIPKECVKCHYEPMMNKSFDKLRLKLAEKTKKLLQAVARSDKLVNEIAEWRKATKVDSPSTITDTSDFHSKQRERVEKAMECLRPFHLTSRGGRVIDEEVKKACDTINTLRAKLSQTKCEYTNTIAVDDALRLCYEFMSKMTYEELGIKGRRACEAIELALEKNKCKK